MDTPYAFAKWHGLDRDLRRSVAGERDAQGSGESGAADEDHHGLGREGGRGGFVRSQQLKHPSRDGGRGVDPGDGPGREAHSPPEQQRVMRVGACPRRPRCRPLRDGVAGSAL